MTTVVVVVIVIIILFVVLAIADDRYAARRWRESEMTEPMSCCCDNGLDCGTCIESDVCEFIPHECLDTPEFDGVADSMTADLPDVDPTDAAIAVPGNKIPAHVMIPSTKE